MRDRDQNPPHALGTGEPFPLSPLSSAELEASWGRDPHAPQVPAVEESQLQDTCIWPCAGEDPRAHLVQNTYESFVSGCGLWEGCPPGPFPSFEFTEGFFPFKYFWDPCTWKSGQGQSWSGMKEKFYSIFFNNL